MPTSPTQPSLTHRLTERMNALDERARGWVIGGVRILAALLWLANLHWKVPPDFGQKTGGGLFKYSAAVSRHSTFAPFTWVTEEIIVKNFRFFGWVTLLSETALALLLLIGYRTKIVALAGAAISVPIFLSVLYYDRADEWSWSYFLMIGVHLILYASNAGRFIGIDGLLAQRRDGNPRAVRTGVMSLGIVGTVVGLLGLFVARSVDFAGKEAALLGSDAGFTANGRVTRRWELKFLWFNPLWALLTIAFGIALIVGAAQLRKASWARVAIWVGAFGYAAMAIVVLGTNTFRYLRDDGAVQLLSTSPNTAFWGALALGAALLARKGTSTERSADA